MPRWPTARGGGWRRWASATWTSSWATARWAGAAGGCFDAILVAAGGPEVPPALKAQLADGGRLVIPVGEPRHQQLVRLRRRGEGDFDREVIAAVAFVPLIGAQGWPDEGAER